MPHTTDKKSLAQQTADELSRMIIEGNEFHAGEKLPNEIELSSRFGVSRATLREAIRMLVAQRLIEVRHGIGTFVSEQLPHPADYGFHDLIKIKSDVRDLFEARLIFEPRVCALAVRRATDAEIAEILHIEQNLQTAYENGIDVMEYDRRFHTALIKCVRNPFLEQVITIISDAIEKLLMIIEVNQVQDVVARDHKYIMEFLKNRDELGMESAMKIHILHGIQELESFDKTL